MPLSISKLQDLLITKGFVINKFFVMDGVCFYMELFAICTADVFLLYIPSKYNFEVKGLPDTYKIKYVDMEATTEVADEYGQVPQHYDYENINEHLSPDKDKMKEHLENNYKQQISLSDISNDDTTMLKAIYRQMNRLKYCTQSVKYKLAIFYKNYICSIRRDDSINCFVIKNYPRNEVLKMFVVVDLETLYEKNEKLLEDIHTVRESIYRILEKNQGMHSRVIDKMIENRKDIIQIPLQAQQKKDEYDILINKCTEMLNTMIQAEDALNEELNLLNQDRQDRQDQPSGLQSDITKAHQRAKLDKEIGNINMIKGEIAKTLLAIREKRENTILSIDKIMFDNTIMFDCMIKNFAKLKEFC